LDVGSRSAAVPEQPPFAWPKSYFSASGAFLRGRSYLVLSILLLVVAAITGCSGARSHANEADVLSRSIRLLDRASQDPSNTIPDAVLNAAKCIMVQPDGATRGAMTCRDDRGQWQRPRFVSFEPRVAPGLLLVMNSQIADAIARGGARGSALPGPLTRESPLPGDGQPKSDLLAYSWDGQRVAGAKRETVSLHRDSGDAPSRLGQAFENSVASFANTILPTGIIIHHSGVVPSETINERAVDIFHQERGFDVMCFGREYHVAYHYLVLADGTVQSGRPERCEGAHARGYNSYVGIALAGDFSSQDNLRGEHGLATPTAKQMDALIRLCRELRDHYRIPLQHVLRHSDVATTHCPGDRFPFHALLRGLEHP
jgi:N-acetylmuramoyl-L-alanine amidase